MPDIIIAWDGLHANIPSGWTRYTALDDKYPKASSSDLAGTGGSATHSHTGASHTHSYSSNSHTHATGDITGGVTQKTNGQHQDSPAYDVASNPHTHASQTSGAFTGESITSDGFTTGTATNEYSRYHFIFLKGSVNLPLPSGAVVMRNDATSRPSSAHFDDMDDRYMKGATTAGNSGSGTDVTTHTHTQSHSHTLTHNHGSVSSGNVTSGIVGTNNTGQGVVENHSHTVNFTQHQESPTNSDPVAAATATLKYRELHFWKISTAQSSQIGDIVMSIESDVPGGWTDLGYNDEYIRGKAEGQSLSTGGSHSHTHADLSHTHVGTSHTHAYSTTTDGGGNRDHSNLGPGDVSGSHSHSGTTGSATNSTTGSTAVSISTDSAEPLHVKVKFIRKTSVTAGSFFFQFMHAFVLMIGSFSAFLTLVGSRLSEVFNIVDNGVNLIHNTNYGKYTTQSRFKRV